METLYRIAWENKVTGANGHGDWFSSNNLGNLRAYMEYANINLSYGRVRYFIENNKGEIL